MPHIILAAAQTPGVYYAYENSDSVGQIIVVFLLLFNAVVWTAMIYKWSVLSRAKRLCNRFVSQFQQEGEKNMTSRQLLRELDVNDSPVAEIYRAGMEKLLDFYSANQDMGGGGRPEPCKLSEAQCNAVEAVLEREISTQIRKSETQIGLLATAVSLSPFCGLFGTVWGVMMAFCGIAAAGKSDFTALAPGVAGALLTTVAGLVVAIPSLVGYNLLTGTIRNLTVTMDNFAEQFMVCVKLSQLELEKNRRDRGM